MRAAAGTVALFVVLLSTSPAAATWSIVAVDPDSGQVGVAVASCVPIEFLDQTGGFELVVLAGGIGAGVTQAALKPEARDEIDRLLVAGESADDIIAALTDPSFDDGAQDRQHGVALLNGEVAGFTGAGNSAVALDRQRRNVSAQGNILVSESVIDDALDAFEADPSSPLANRLIDALEAGGLAGGDSRCGAQTALFAHLSVIDGDGIRAEPNVAHLTYGVTEGSGENPVAIMASEFRSGTRFNDPPEGSGNRAVGRLGFAVVALVLVGGVSLVMSRTRRRRRVERSA